MFTPLPTAVPLANESYVRFVNERCRLQRVIGSLAAQVRVGHVTKFVVDEWRELVECRLVAPIPTLQELCYVTRLIGNRRHRAITVRRTEILSLLQTGLRDFFSDARMFG